MVRIDGLGLLRLDFIKIDIEGMEMEALTGAEATLRKFRPQLMIEKIKSDETQLRDFVNELGYKVFPMGLNLLAIHESDPAVNQISCD